MTIPHNRLTLSPQETAATERVLASGWLAQGSEVTAFEQEVCTFLGLPEGHAVALSSGTAALFMALWALSAAGKTIGLPVYSCAAVRNAVMMAGATPLAIDVAEGTPNLDPWDAIRQGANIVIAAHLFGIPCRCDLGSLPVPVIEDCAQAFGTRKAGHPVGLSGTVGIFSFYSTKMITTGGQGGMLVSRDKGLIDAVRDYREFDCRQDRKPRFNLQLTDLQAAVGRAQLSHLNSFLQRRQDLYTRYVSAGLPLWPDHLPGDSKPCRYRCLLRVTDPTAVIAQLAQSGVRAIRPIEEWELLDDPEKFPQARALTQSLVSIPIYPSLSESEVATILAALASSP